MNTHPQVGKDSANFPLFMADVGKLANTDQFKFSSHQCVAELSANWQVGNAANVPTDTTPHGCRDFPLSQVGENSPSYYVGEGPEGPSTLRGEVAGCPMVDGHHASVTAVLALDLGTQTGWALHGRDCIITSGTEHFQPQRFEGGGMRFLRFKRWLTEIKQTTDGIDSLYFEEVRRHAGVDAAHAYGGFMAHLTAWCEHHAIPYQGVPVGTIKKHATGKGNATKAAMLDAMRDQGFQPEDDNEADALALLLWALDRGEV